MMLLYTKTCTLRSICSKVITVGWFSETAGFERLGIAWFHCKVTGWFIARRLDLRGLGLDTILNQMRGGVNGTKKAANEHIPYRDTIIYLLIDEDDGIEVSVWFFLIIIPSVNYYNYT